MVRLLILWFGIKSSKPKVRKLAIRVNLDLASLPGPSWFPGLCRGFRFMLVSITDADMLLLGLVIVLVFSVRFTSFLGTLHWPSGSLEDMGHFGSFFPFSELLILFEQWAGHRLLSEKVTRPHVRANRPILIPSVPVSEGIEIRHGCQFLSSLVCALAKLPGGLGRFLPCGLGSHMSRLRHLGWNQCSHGLDSRPLESCHHECLKALCGVLGYPKGSALELLDGTLKLRHCTDLFTRRFPPWSLPRVGSGIGKGILLLLIISRILVVLWVKGSGLPRRLVQAHPLMSFRTQILGTQRRGDGKDCAPLSPKEREERWACLAIFFLALGLGDGYLHLGTPGTCTRRQQA